MKIENDFINSLKPSAIRKITGQIDEKKAEGIHIAPFAGGRPDKGTFPICELAEITSKIFAEDDGECVQYAASSGYMPLRQELAKLMKKVDVETKAGNILPFAGSTQALAYIARAILSGEDGAVVCEEPSYVGALDIFRSYGKELIGIPMDEEGMDPVLLEEALKTKKVLFVYVIPDYQNPTGRVMSLSRRKQILEIVKKYHVLLIEDAPYSFLSFDRQILPAIKSMDHDQDVVYIGSFSKTIAPGVRIGWVDADESFIQKLVFMKTIDDLQVNNLAQRQVQQYLANYDFDGHLNMIRDLYRDKGGLMMKLVRESFPQGTRIIEPKGGMFMWIELPEPMDAEELFRYVIAHNIAFVPGTFFYTKGGGKNTLRMNFSMPDREEISANIPKFGKLACDYLEEIQK